jgi:hypothetical protein
VIDTGEDADRVKRYFSENAVDARVVVDPRQQRMDPNGPIAKTFYGGAYVPHTVLLAPDRRVIFSGSGLQDQPLFEAIESLLKKKEPRLF